MSTRSNFTKTPLQSVIAPTSDSSCATTPTRPKRNSLTASPLNARSQRLAQAQDKRMTEREDIARLPQLPADPVRSFTFPNSHRLTP